MRVLVTGADGFVGEHLCPYLRAAGDEVVEARGPEDAERALDLTDAGSVRAAVERARPDWIVNLAGFSSVAESHRNPVRAWAVNAAGSVNLVTAVREVAPKARVLLIGSGEMYGPLPAGVRAIETMPLNPVSPYAASKAAAELAGLQFHKAYGLDVILARPFNHLGAGQKSHFVVPGFALQLQRIRRGNSPPVLKVGNPEIVRDFSNVADLISALRTLLLSGEPGIAYNICSGTGSSIANILREMVRLAEVEVSIEQDPSLMRVAEIPAMVGDPSKMLKLGWAPRFSLSATLESIWAQSETAASR
jgi:GDP-4-dehydro-6-deoxy-D-mannose reductase